MRKDSSEFLTTTDVDRIVEQLERLGVETVNLGGNEPIYTHGPRLGDTILPYIIERLASAGIPVGLTTNGVTFWYLDRYHPKALALVNDIDFSLDSPNREEHDLNRGVALFDFVVEQIRRCRELGIDCSIISCGMKATFEPPVLEEFLRLASALDCEFRVNTLKPVERTLIEQMPTPAQFFAGFAYLMSNSECITLGESCITAFTETGDHGCPCGTTSFRINAKDASGGVSLNPCVYGHDFKSGDLLTQDIFDIVGGNEFTRFRARRDDLPAACREADCEFLETCRGGCTARSYLVHGSLDQRDPYCPIEYLETAPRPNLPVRPTIGLEEGIRVHDHYLCTWIGKPTIAGREPVAPRHSGASARLPFLDEPGLPISGHVQVAGLGPDGDGASLVPIQLVRKPQPREPLVAQAESWSTSAS